MVYNLYSIYDEKARVFSPPRKGLNVEVFKREIHDELAEAKETFREHAGDFKMYHVADYDDSNAAFEPLSPPEFICPLSELI